MKIKKKYWTCSECKKKYKQLDVDNNRFVVEVRTLCEKCIKKSVKKQ